MEELKSSRLIAGKKFPNFEMMGAKIVSAWKQDHTKFLRHEEGSVWKNRKIQMLLSFHEEDRSVS